MEMDPTNISFSGLELELGLGLGIEVDDKPTAEADSKSAEITDERTRTPESDSSYTSASTTQESPSSGENALPSASEPASVPRVRDSPAQSHITSPPGRGSEVGLGGLTSNGSISGRTPRISREDMQRRLMRQRSVDSPVPDDKPADHEDDVNRMSTTTDFDLSNAEMGTIETVVEKRNVAMSVATPPKALPLLHPDIEGDELKFDMGQFGMGSPGMDLGKGMSIGFGGEVDVDMRSALDRLMDDVAGSAGAKTSTPPLGGKDRKARVRVEAITEGIKAGRFEPDDSMHTETEEDGDQSRERAVEMTMGMGRPPLGRAATEPDLFTSTGVSRTASGSTIPPPPPPKDAIRAREELVLEKRREARKREEDESLGYYTPPRPSDRVLNGRPIRRRSRSTGDMEELAKMRGESGSGLLDIGGLEGKDDDDLQDSIQRELRKLGGARSVSLYLNIRAWVDVH